MKTPVIGIAFANDMPEGKYERYQEIIRNAGGEPKVLRQIELKGLTYLSNGTVDEAMLEFPGMLRSEYADRVKRGDPTDSNVEDVMEGIDGVFFPGGKDITPSLLKVPEPVGNGGEAINIARDVSDYLLMVYCLKHDIPLLAVCHGEQILGIAEGCTLIQDMRNEYSDEICNAHRIPPEVENRDYARGDIVITDPQSLIASIANGSVLRNAALWHHQCLKSVEGTDLKVTAVTRIAGTEIIQCVENKNLRFCLGVQFHPEIDCGADFDTTEKIRCDEDTCLEFFRRLVKASCG